MSGPRFIAGIDHSFSLPAEYFRIHQLSDWDGFLDHFTGKWPADIPVKQSRDKAETAFYHSRAMRLTETLTRTAKSSVDFSVKQGQVATSTHAGIPWLSYLRRRFQNKIHFWPFDGLSPAPDKNVIAEVYPSILRPRYQKEIQSDPELDHPDKRDSWVIARWLADRDTHGLLNAYFHPPLSKDEESLTSLEGWILGVM
ncbi:MAG: hypothetical protein K9L68_04410 [Spirochaetales bacterium]|nr:hypothetical protein [Spirochaetales bacterium]MCF7937820.1 hypothetical protein [Spirochaetales bacterium]